MAIERPTLATIIQRIATDFESRLPGADARARRSVLGVLTRAYAGAVHGLYGYLATIARMAIPDLAEGEALERWARIWLRGGRLGSAIATGAVRFTGAAGSVIPAGAVVVRADGVRYTTLASVVLSPNGAVARVVAEVAGADGNASAGAELGMAAQVVGVAARVLVAEGGIVGGADAESDQMMRTRLIQRIQRPPQGGAAYDYEAWALEVPGVTRVWVRPLWMGPGTVGVLFMRDGDVAGAVPDEGELAMVQAHLDSVRPVTAKVYALAPEPLLVNLRVRVMPDTADVRAAVVAELDDAIRRVAEPGKTLRVGTLHEAITAASGETDHVIMAPVADVAMAAHQMPMLGAVAWE